jgi:hypothetical protein
MLAVPGGANAGAGRPGSRQEKEEELLDLTDRLLALNAEERRVVSAVRAPA